MSKVKTTQMQKNSVGRPRSLIAHTAILKAARSILDEVGPARLTIESVAKRAKVGKPTIYRSWANAQELVMTALVDGDETHILDEKEDILALVETIIARLNTKRGRHMALMLASAEPDGELFKGFANRVILEGRNKGLVILQNEIVAGKIRHDADLKIALDMIFGAIMLRLLLRHELLDTNFAQQSISVIMDGLRPQSASSK